MKKHHIINQSTGKCFCGIESNNQLIAFNDGDDWYDSKVYPIDHSNYTDKLCVNCMKQYDVQLIEKFEMDAFLIDYNNRLPNGKRAMRFFKRQAQLKRQSIDRTIIKAKPTEKPIQSKPADKPIIQSDKGKARAERKKANQSKKVNQSKPSDDKCKVIAKPADQSKPDKPIKEDKSIDQKINDRKPLIDLSNGPVLIETIEDGQMDDSFAIGDPINDDSIFELGIGNDWKMVRHSKKLNQWKLVNRQVVKGIPKWIDDSEFIDYNEIAELINDGYCE